MKAKRLMKSDTCILVIDVLREVYPNASMGCFINKPVSIDYLIKKLSAELD